MTGLHCYLGWLPACSCGWNYLVCLAWCPSFSLSFLQEEEEEASILDVLDVDWLTADSLPRIQENKSPLLIYLSRNPWKQNAAMGGCGVIVDKRLALKAKSNPLLRFFLFVCFFQLVCLFHSIICLYIFLLDCVTTSNGNVNSALTCGFPYPLNSNHST